MLRVPSHFGVNSSPRGVCYYKQDDNQCKDNSGGVDDSYRNDRIKQFAGVFNKLGIPWLYWQAIPNKDPHVCPSFFSTFSPEFTWCLRLLYFLQQGLDFEVGIVDDNSWATLTEVAKEATNGKGAWDFSRWLL